MSPAPVRELPLVPLTAALRRAAGDATERAALDAVDAAARAGRAAGRSPNQVAVLVRRALAAAAPGAMTVVAFDAVARRLVQHALRSYFDAGDPPGD